MDPEGFLDLANQVTKLKMFPYFDIAHSVLCALAVREDLGPGKSTKLLYILNIFRKQLLCLINREGRRHQYDCLLAMTAVPFSAQINRPRP